MRALPVPRVWTRLNFSVKFAAIIAIAGILIAIIPLSLANDENRSQAAERATDNAGIVVNLIGAQEASLASFASGMAQELGPPLLKGDSVAVLAALRRYSQVNAASDMVGVSGPLGTEAVRNGIPAGVTTSLAGAVQQQDTGGAAVVALDTAPWLVASATATGTQEHIFIARPIGAPFLRSLDATIATPTGPAGLALVRAGRVASGGSTVLQQPLPAGGALDGALATSLTHPGTSQVVAVGAGQAGVDALNLGGGFAVLVSTPVSGVSALWQPIAILLGLIVIAMLCIVLVVQVDLQRPLRRLDRAVAALAADQYDVPLPRMPNDEIGRLAGSFEEMRRQLRATVTTARARAVIASSLNSPRPLETALHDVCVQLRESASADSAFILVNGSEMTDSFTVTDGVTIEGDVAALLNEEGPLGSAFRHRGPEALAVGAAATSSEAAHGLREFCAAPLRMGPSVLGVAGVARAAGGFTSADAALVATSAEQVTLSLERYRFIAMVQRQASTDDLTGLYNHRFLVDYLGQQVALAERLNTPLALLIIDLDHFKNVNDTYGHPVGDVVLNSFAQTLTHSIRRADLAARYGGEEFIVVMSNTAAADARHVAEKIRLAAGGMTVAVDGGRTALSVTVSIGGAAYPEDTGSAAELLATADAALYDAKHAGRDRVCMAGDGDGDGDDEMEEARDVTSAVSSGRSAQ